MPEYQFNIQGSVYKDPLNWRELEAGIEFDGRDVFFSELGNIEFCDSGLKAVLDGLDICSEALLAIFSRKTELQAFTNLVYAGFIPVKDMQEDCDTGQYSLSTKRYGPADKMNKVSSQEICIPTTDQLSLFEIETGGYFEDLNGNEIKREFINIPDLMREMMIEAGTAISLTGLGSNLMIDYREDDVQIGVIPNLNGGDVAVLTLTGSMGQTYTATVTAPGGGMTNDDLGQALADCFHYFNPGTDADIQMTMNEFEQRVSRVEKVASNTIVIYADWEIQSVDLSVNSVSIFSKTVATSSFTMGFGDLYISPKGNQGAQVCMNWDSIKKLIISLSNPVFENTSTNDVNIFRWDRYFTNTLGPDPITEAENVRIRKDDSWMVPKASFGYAFRHTDYEDAVTNWNWQLRKEFFTDPFGLNFVSQAGNYAIKGLATITNTGASTTNFTVELFINGASIGTGISGSLNAGQSQSLDLDDFFLLASLTNDQFYRTSPNDSIQLRILVGSPDIQPLAPHTAYAEEIQPFASPFFDEDYIYEFQNGVDIDDFAGCTGYRTETANDDFYAGHGFAFHQNIVDAKYEDTYFLTYADSITGKATRFEKRLYFPSGLSAFPAILQDTTRSIYFYNAPISFVNILHMWRQQIPSPVTVKSYDFVASVDASGNITGSKSFSNKSLPALTDRINIMNFEICSSYNQPLDIISNMQVSIDGICNKTGNAIARFAKFKLGTNRITMEVLI